MTDLTLTIGDKNLSSWSFRPWYLLKQAGIPFTEEIIRLDRQQTRKILKEKSPSGLVPFLTHGEVKIWDSLAILEYVADLFPEMQLWPEDITARGAARALAAEMHAGFSALRTVWPMAVARQNLAHLTSGGVQRDIDRINELWTEARRRYGANAKKDEGYLFGTLSIADAMYAPVVSRFITYGPVTLTEEASAYLAHIRSSAAYLEWEAGAIAENKDR